MYCAPWDGCADVAVAVAASRAAHWQLNIQPIAIQHLSMSSTSKPVATGTAVTPPPPLPSRVSLLQTSTDLHNCEASPAGPPSTSVVPVIWRCCVCSLITMVAAAVDAQMWQRSRRSNNGPPPCKIGSVVVAVSAVLVVALTEVVAAVLFSIHPSASHCLLHLLFFMSSLPQSSSSPPHPPPRLHSIKAFAHY